MSDSGPVSVPAKAVLFCTCSGSCPSMEKVDFWALSERVRLELGEGIEFMALHPRLCEEDGERLMARVLRPDLAVVTPACAEKRQEKLLRDGFARAGVPMDRVHWIPISMVQQDTDAVFAKIRAAVEPPVAAAH
jgi:heterodisulfide reductase subunit A-like polyferredoxin